MIDIGWIVVLTFALRAAPNLLGINHGGGDQTYHFIAAQAIRDNNYRLPDKLKGFLLPGVYDYPPLFHYLLAIFPRTTREKIAPFTGAVIDSVQVLILYFFSLWLFQQPQLIHYAADATKVAGTASLLFATSPTLLYWGCGPRAYHATPRALGELFTAITFLGGLVYYSHGGSFILLLTGIFAALALLTSKFSAQVLVFFTIGMAGFLKAPSLMSLPMLGAVCAVIFSGGHYRSILIGWLKHLILYQQIIMRHLLVSRNRLAEFRNLFASVRARNFKGCLVSGRSLLVRNTYVILAVRYLGLIALIILAAINWEHLAQNREIIYLLSWIAVSVIIFFIISLRPFLFLGESDRYLEYSLPAQVIVLSLMIHSFNAETLLVSMLVYHGGFYLLTFLWIYVDFRYVLPKKEQERRLFEWLRREGISGKKVLYIDNIPYEIIYETNNLVLFPPGNFTHISKDQFVKLWQQLPWPSTDLERLIKEYGFEYIIVYRKNVALALQKGWVYKVDQYSIIYKNDAYDVYKI
ncbi:MAG: hypothetical protein HZB33_14245 [Nitrospirae bacterium]|nr:hypothetical protein [Nitrospirota bacterium]